MSGYAVRPARVRKEKLRISAFISADVEYSRARPRPGSHLFRPASRHRRRLDPAQRRRPCLQPARRRRHPRHDPHLGALVGQGSKADALTHALELRLDEARGRAAALAHRPRVYFEEWDEPMISGIRWVSELIDIAGGVDVFAALSRAKNAKDRIVSEPELIAAAPDIIVGSWCGKKFVPAKVAARPGLAEVPAVRDGFLREIKSPLILQPGPAALTDGALLCASSRQLDSERFRSTPRTY